MAAEATAEFDTVFAALKMILLEYAPYVRVHADEPGNYYLNTPFFQKNKAPLMFAAVQIKKNYVSYHLMPLYMNPALLESLSPELRARMQGKACFNFKKRDDTLFHELALVTRRGFAEYQAAGYWSAQDDQEESIVT